MDALIANGTRLTTLLCVASLIYVTGVSGAGKSSVRRKLRRQGNVAYGTDEDGIGAFFDASGAMVQPDEVIDSAAWRVQHTWKIVPERLDILAEATPGPVFVCGSAANEGAMWHRFAAVIVLIIDEPTLLHRLAIRTHNNFGKSSDERDRSVGWLHSSADIFRSYGAIMIDATEPLETVVATILAVATEFENGRAHPPRGFLR